MNPCLQAAQTWAQRLTNCCLPPWAPVLRLPWGCTPGGKDGRSRRSLSICDIRRYTPSIVPSATRKKESGIGLNGHSPYGSLTDEQRSKLLDIANKCPVCRTLKSKSVIVTRAV